MAGLSSFVQETVVTYRTHGKCYINLERMNATLMVERMNATLLPWGGVDGQTSEVTCWLSEDLEWEQVL